MDYLTLILKKALTDTIPRPFPKRHVCERFDVILGQESIRVELFRVWEVLWIVLHAQGVDVDGRAGGNRQLLVDLVILLSNPVQPTHGRIFSKCLCN